MSQVLGKPQLEDGDDDEEDELVGLADYGDGPDSSDADPDSGAEEGGERGVPGARTPSRRCPPAPAGPSARAADCEGIQQSGVAGWGWGGRPSDCQLQNGGARVQAAMGAPGSVGRAERGRGWVGAARSPARCRAGASPSSAPSSERDLGGGEGRVPRARPGTSP